MSPGSITQQLPSTLDNNHTFNNQVPIAMPVNLLNDLHCDFLSDLPGDLPDDHRDLPSDILGDRLDYHSDLTSDILGELPGGLGYIPGDLTGDLTGDLHLDLSGDLPGDLPDGLELNVGCSVKYYFWVISI